MKKTILIIYVVCISFINIYPQSPKLKNFSFGEYYYLEKDNDTVGDEGEEYDTVGVVRSQGTFYVHKRNIGQNEFNKLINSDFLNYIFIRSSKMDGGIVSMNWDNDPDTISPTIDLDDFSSRWVNLEGNIFRGKILFNNFRLSGMIELENNIFEDWVFLSYGIIKETKLDSISKFIEGTFYIRNNKFYESLDIRLVNVFCPTIISFNEFRSGLQLGSSEFFNSFLFSQNVIKQKFEISNTTFHSRVNFSGVVISDSLEIRKSTFRESFDLRGTVLDSMTYFDLENTEYNIGELLIDWEAIKRRGGFVINIDTSERKRSDIFYSLRNIYEKLAANFDIQNKKNDADDVLFELELRRQQYIPNTLHTLYGLTFGFGYQPWKFLLLVAFIICIYSAFLYSYFYRIIIGILDSDTKPTQIIKESKKFGFPTYFENTTGIIGKDKQIRIPAITRFWHSLFFGTSIILGFRFKKEWIHKKDSKFLLWVSLGWLLGVILYITFVLLVKGQRFAFIKGIFGI